MLTQTEILTLCRDVLRWPKWKDAHGWNYIEGDMAYWGVGGLWHRIQDRTSLLMDECRRLGLYPQIKCGSETVRAFFDVDGRTCGGAGDTPTEAIVRALLAWHDATKPTPPASALKPRKLPVEDEWYDARIAELEKQLADANRNADDAETARMIGKYRIDIQSHDHAYSASTYKTRIWYSSDTLGEAVRLAAGKEGVK